MWHYVHMNKTFRPWNVDDVWLLPPSVQELVPEGHPAHFVRDLARHELDLSPVFASYTEERGYPPYHPAMMAALLLYAYSRGVHSSRRIARCRGERVDFMAVTANQRPDRRTISDFRRRHLEALGGLFPQVLALCRAAGLARLGHVSLDGTKIKANASKHRAMSYGRMVKAEAELKAVVEGWLKGAAAADAAEDAEHGADRRGDEMPDWVADRRKRLARIRQAKAALEAEAQAKAKDGQGPPGGGVAEGEAAKPADKAQRNFTDPESRILRTGDGFIQGWNAQAAADAGDQVIVACGIGNTGSDQDQLVPMLDAIERESGRLPGELSADAGSVTSPQLTPRAFRARRFACGSACGSSARRRSSGCGRRRRRGPAATASPPACASAKAGSTPPASPASPRRGWPCRRSPRISASACRRESRRRRPFRRRRTFPTSASRAGSQSSAASGLSRRGGPPAGGRSGR